MSTEPAVPCAGLIIHSLSLKSSPASSSTTSGSAPAFAVLTTHNQTFQLRQVQSSNSIFLVQPSGISNAGADTICTPPSLSIVSQSKATLELSQVSANPVPYLEKLLPLYNGPHEDEDASPLTAPPGIIMNRRSKRSVFEDIPASDDEVEKGWRDMCAFENNGQALRPSVVYLVELWQAIMSVATAQGIDMTERFQFSDLWEMLEVDGWPESLIDAVLQILSKVDNTPKDGWMLLDRDKSIRWIGANMLKAQGQVSIPISEFEDAWKNELPEQWGMSAKLDVLEVCWIFHSWDAC